MSKLCNRFYCYILADKKFITLFTTLVNIKCLSYYVFSRVLFQSNVKNAVVYMDSHFVASVIIAILDLLLCWGFIHSCIKTNDDNVGRSEEETQSALNTAKSLKELYCGNIISSGIYSFDYVTQIEQNSVKGDEIWCISGDIEEDSKNMDLGSIINNNLKNEVVYKYFITRVGETISSKASWGEQTLREANLAYKKRLKFIKTKEELIAPDIDIIIYKANHINERVGFVCVEIGDDQNTYVYQKIDRITLQGICDRLKEYDSTKTKFNYLPSIGHWVRRVVHFFIDHLSIAYFIVSAGGLALLSFSKIVSLMSAVLFVVPAVIEFLITVALMIRITDSISTYKEELNTVSQNEYILASFINSQAIKSVAEELEKKTLDTIMYQKGLGHTDKILQIDESCSAIWLLSDLSHDIADPNFYGWLTRELNEHPDLECYVLYTTGTAAVGRTQKLNRLKSIYPNRIKPYPLTNISTHYIWSETHGIIFIENISKQHDVYISLGVGNDAFYKKVITTEKEAATLLGRLANIAGIKP